MKRAILTAEQAMFSRQRRYMSEKSILTAIDDARARQKAAFDRSDRFLMAHKFDPCVLGEEDWKLINKLNEAQGFETTDYKGMSLFFQGKAQRMEDRIWALGQKLSAFRTGLLEGITTDPAVV